MRLRKRNKPRLFFDDIPVKNKCVVATLLSRAKKEGDFFYFKNFINKYKDLKFKVTDIPCMVFDGVQEYIKITDPTVPSLVNFEFRIKPTGGEWQIVTNYANLYEIVGNELIIGRVGSSFFSGNIDWIKCDGHMWIGKNGSGVDVPDLIGNINGVAINIDPISFYGFDNQASPFNLLNGNSHGLIFTISGTAYKESNKAYGLVADYVLNRSNTHIFYPISDSNTTGSENGYLIEALFQGSLSLYRRDGGVSTQLFTSGPGYITAGKNHRILVFRNSKVDEFVTGGVGTFAVFIQGRDGYSITSDQFTKPDLSKMELVGITTDNTYTTSKYLLPDLDVGDKISNLRTDECAIDLHTFVEGTGSYSKDFIPTRLNNELKSTDVDVGWSLLTNPPIKGHNGASSKITPPISDLLLSLDTENFLYNATTQEPKNISFSDRQQQIGNNIFMNVSKNNQLTMLLIYDLTLTQSEIDKIKSKLT